MRDIKFRAKEVDSKKWYYGSYLKQDKSTFCFKEDYDATSYNTQHFILFDEMVDWGLPNRHLRADIIPATLGQYTGIKDKNCKEIYEGDLFSLNEVIFEVVWFDGAFYVTDEIEMGLLSDFIKYNKNAEVIGNIYDNPEIIER